MATFTAIFDACVLYPAPLRDTLLHIAKTGLFRARWTEHIHAEWIENLVAAGRERKKLQRTRGLMDAAVPDCLVTKYEPLIDKLELPDPDDRHVLAAAIVGRADVIVTSNLRHFPTAALAKFGIKAQHPDDFIACQFDLAPALMVKAIKTQRAALKYPPKSVEEFLETLSNLQLPQTVVRLKAYSDMI